MSVEPVRQSKGSIQLLQALRTDNSHVSNLLQLLELDVPKTSSHKLRHITERFSHPSAVIVIGALTTCVLVQRISAREFDVITIESETEYQRLKVAQLQSIICKKLTSNSCIQSPLYKKIVFVLDLEQMQGIIGYNVDSKHLMIGESPLQLETHQKLINCKNAIHKFLITREWDNKGNGEAQ